MTTREMLNQLQEMISNTTGLNARVGTGKEAGLWKVAGVIVDMPGGTQSFVELDSPRVSEESNIVVYDDYPALSNMMECVDWDDAASILTEIAGDVGRERTLPEEQELEDKKSMEQTFWVSLPSDLATKFREDRRLPGSLSGFDSEEELKSYLSEAERGNYEIVQLKGVKKERMKGYDYRWRLRGGKVIHEWEYRTTGFAEEPNRTLPEEQELEKVDWRIELLNIANAYPMDKHAVGDAMIKVADTLPDIPITFELLGTALRIGNTSFVQEKDIKELAERTQAYLRSNPSQRTLPEEQQLEIAAEEAQRTWKPTMWNPRADGTEKSKMLAKIMKGDGFKEVSPAVPDLDEESKSVLDDVMRRM
jgi:hypothetical protein